jgi:trehalose/maltose hydrolase-like predicted phosphorylase
MESEDVSPATAAPQRGDLFDLDADPRWLLVVDGWAAKREPAIEGALALVNGYLGTRAAVEEGSQASAPATFLAGVFGTPSMAAAQAAATPDRQVIAAPTDELVVAPNWSKLRVVVHGIALTMDTAEVLAHRRVLDLRRGVLVREWRLRVGDRTTRLRSLRFASLDDRHVLGQAVEVVAEDWSGEVMVEATADIEVTGDDELQRRARFALYHLIGCANPDDRRTAPGARSLTGERYKGHVFWDNEMFVVPFLVYTDPPTARAVLGYRYHTLPAARENARSRGWRGAAYAWESADSGEDVTPAYYFTASGERKDTRTGEQEHHLNADVGFAVWQYWQATGDEDYLLAEGAEILFELARFWVSRAECGSDGRWHVHAVIGPDEYHEGVDDNAYTNQLAGWLLDRAGELASWLRERHPDRCGLWGRRSA